jgi:hypothetical protein
MSQELWPFETVVGFLTHPIPVVRLWAVDYVLEEFPQRAAEALVGRLDDPDGYIVWQTARALAASGEEARVRPALQERLQRGDAHFSAYAEALAMLGDRGVIPAVTARLELLLHSEELGGELRQLVHALELIGGDAAGEALWRLLQHLPRDATDRIDRAYRALVQVMLPQGLERALQGYRVFATPESRPLFLTALAERVMLAELLWELMNDWAFADPEELLDYAALELGGRPALAPAWLAQVMAATATPYAGAGRMLLQEARRLWAARGDAIDAWATAWQAGNPLTRYQATAAYSALLLQALAARVTFDDRCRREELGLALALVMLVSVDGDEETLVATAAEPEATALALLVASRQHLAPSISDRVVALGRARLADWVGQLREATSPWPVIRGLHALAQIAQTDPEGVAPYADEIIGLITDAQPDDLLDAAADALEAIGPSAIPVLAAVLDDADAERVFWATVTLSHFTTPEAGHLLLERFRTVAPGDPFLANSLARLGLRAAFEPLIACWHDSHEPEIAEHLVILCALHHIDHPELPRWQEVLAMTEAGVSLAEEPASSSAAVVEPEDARWDDDTAPPASSSPTTPAKKTRKNKSR